MTNECDGCREGIDGYYERVRCKQSAARERWEKSPEYPRHGPLYKAYIDAGNTGD